MSRRAVAHLALWAGAWWGCLPRPALAVEGVVVDAPATKSVEFRDAEDKQLAIYVGGEFWGAYAYRDPAIKRPYFGNVHAAADMPVTRRHPPVAGQDLDDHAQMHPGLWMAFGDLDGCDFWRGKAEVEHLEFLQRDAGGTGTARFAVRNAYRCGDDRARVVCYETARYGIHALQDGVLLTWDATFASDVPFAFGDQEEMGLGMRLATPLRAERTPRGAIAEGTGHLLDAEGRVGETQIWGQTARWCDASGERAGRRIGICLFCHPDNFGPSWFHARDYGLLVANPFGRQALRQGAASRVEVAAGEALRLRYGVFTYATSPGAPAPDYDGLYQDYLELATEH